MYNSRHPEKPDSKVTYYVGFREHDEKNGRYTVVLREPAESQEEAERWFHNSQNINKEELKPGKYHKIVWHHTLEHGEDSFDVHLKKEFEVEE